MKKFNITYFSGPTPEFIVRPEIIKDMKDCGIDLAQIGLSYDVETIKKTLPILAENGMKATICDPRIAALYRNGGSDEEIDRVVSEVVEDYKEFDNIIEYDLADEPSNENFPMLGKLVSAFKKHAPELDTVVNLFPNYATAEQLHCPDYALHVEEFVKQVKPSYISYDHYSFLGRESRKATEVVVGEEDERSRLIRLSAETTEDRGEFYENIEIIRDAGLRHGLDTMLIVLLTEHGPYRNLTRAEISWEVNMCLAYGMKRLSYFTYWCPEKVDPKAYWRPENAICRAPGVKLQHYYDVQAVNAKARPEGEYLFDKKTVEVLHTGGEEKGIRYFNGFGGIDALKSERPLVVGFYDDGSAFIANKDYASPTEVEMKAAGAWEVMKDGSFVPFEKSFSLGAGDGVLIRPVKK